MCVQKINFVLVKFPGLALSTPDQLGLEFNSSNLSFDKLLSSNPISATITCCNQISNST